MQARCNTYTADLIPSVWESVKPLIQKGLDRGSSYTIEEIHKGLLSEKMQLFVWESDTPHAAMVTTINNRGEWRECTLLVVGGDKMEEWIGVLPQVEDWARQLNCDEMSIYGRMGWAKALGYKIEYAKMSHKL